MPLTTPRDLSGIMIDVERVAAPIREQVLKQLREAIVQRRLDPGQHLVERELVEETGVSRTTIREVLRQLATEGLVTTIPHKGTVVASTSVESAIELYEVRAALEGMAARQFVERATGSHVQALRKAFEQVEAAARDEDIEGVLEAKRGFYDVFFDGAANTTIRSIVETLQARVTLLRAASLSRPGRCASTIEEVRAIVEAVEGRDQEAAYKACVHHIEQAARSGLTPMADAPEHPGVDDE